MLFHDGMQGELPALFRAIRRRNVETFGPMSGEAAKRALGGNCVPSGRPMSEDGPSHDLATMVLPKLLPQTLFRRISLINGCLLSFQRARS